MAASSIDKSRAARVVRLAARTHTTARAAGSTPIHWFLSGIDGAAMASKSPHHTTAFGVTDVTSS
jgi:hypothetical protein